MNAQTPGSDSIYKRIYGSSEMVADLLRSLFPARDLDIDPGSLRRLPTELVADDHRQRRADSVWRVRADAAPGGWLHIVVLLEFQSTDQARMALRVLEYTTLLYGELVREGRLPPDGLLPPVLPVVLYNGAAPWRSPTQMRELVGATRPPLSAFQPSQRHIVLDERHASADDPRLGDLTRAVLLLEQSRSAADLASAATLLSKRLDADGGDLKRAFAAWLATLLRRLDGGAGAGPAAVVPSLEEVTMTLEERVAEWPKPYIRQGREEGRQVGRQEGISLGRNEGIAQQRGLLRRQAAARFGAATADRLAGALAAESDPGRLAAVGEAIVRSATADELLRQAGAATH